MKEMFSVKPQAENLCFLLKIKSKQNPDCPNKKYNTLFEYIQNIRIYPKSKILGGIRAKQSIGAQVWFVAKTVRGQGAAQT